MGHMHVEEEKQSKLSEASNKVDEPGYMHFLAGWDGENEDGGR